jgi:hypothetical protein
LKSWQQLFRVKKTGTRKTTRGSKSLERYERLKEEVLLWGVKFSRGGIYSLC